MLSSGVIACVVFGKTADILTNLKRLKKKGKWFLGEEMFIDTSKEVMKEVEETVEERFPGERHLRRSRKDRFDAW